MHSKRIRASLYASRSPLILTAIILAILKHHLRDLFKDGRGSLTEKRVYTFL